MLKGIFKNKNVKNLAKTLLSFNEDESSNKAFEPEIIEKEFEDGNQFEKKTYKNIKDVILKLAKGNPKEVISAFTKIVQLAGKTIKFEDYQITKRKEIAAKRDIQIKQIEENSKIIMKYLDKSFDERKNNFEKMFSLLDEAVKTGKTEMVVGCLDKIVNLASSSPFKDLSNIKEVQKALGDKNHEWEL